MIERRIQLRAIGDSPSYPLERQLDTIIVETAQNQGMTLSFALSYGGREEIIQATRSSQRKFNVVSSRVMRSTKRPYKSAYIPDIPA